MLKNLFLWVALLLSGGEILACSMYKITVNGKTWVGNNEDSWRTDARIWFEPSRQGAFGVAYVGYAGKPHPDGGVNEFGLMFDAFTMPHKPYTSPPSPEKPNFAYAHLRTVMQTCRNVDEVYTFFSKHNLHILNGSIIFNGSMLLFVDKAGKYLVVESHKLTRGDDSSFVLANFSIADTKDLSTVKMARYCKGVAFLKNKPPQASLPFCRALSDTMSVNRPKASDGTLYTTIYDLEEGAIHVYFFHDFTQSKTFRLKDELAKGAHGYYFGALFPENKHYARFLAYQTPQNNRLISFSFLLVGALLGFSVYSFLRGFWAGKAQRHSLQILLPALNVALCAYLYTLWHDQSIFYFPAPSYNPHSLFSSVMAYLPLALLAIFPFTAYHAVRITKQKIWKTLPTGLLVGNQLAYLYLLGLFFYWGLFYSA